MVRHKQRLSQTAAVYGKESARCPGNGDGIRSANSILSDVLSLSMDVRFVPTTEVARGHARGIPWFW